MSFFSSSPILTPAPIAPDQLASPRTALVVCRHVMGQPHFLLIGTRRAAHRLTLPGGKIDAEESPLQSAIRETREEAGVLTDRHAPLSSYLHRKASGRLHPTQTYLARYSGYRSDHEPRTIYWLTLRELSDPAYSIRQPIFEQIERAMDILPAYTAAG